MLTGRILEVYYDLTYLIDEFTWICSEFPFNGSFKLIRVLDGFSADGRGDCIGGSVWSWNLYQQLLVDLAPD